MRTGPVAALLILLSLVLGSATAAASVGTSGPATRLAPSRQNNAAALLPSGARASLEDEAKGSGAGPSVLPGRPDVVTEGLSARPKGETLSAASAALRRTATAPYRARAPPAA